MRRLSFNGVLCCNRKKYTKSRRFCCIVLFVVSVLAIHQGIYLGGVHYVIFNSSHASIQHAPTALVNWNVTLQRAVVEDSNNNNFGARTLISAANIRISSQSQQSSYVTKWHSRVVFLHQEDHRALEIKNTTEEQKKSPLELSHMEPWNSNDLESEPPLSVEYFPINVATGQIREGASSTDCQTTVTPWQTSSFPNCNAIHELDFLEDVHRFLSNGEYRDVWKISNYFIPALFTGYEEKETLVLKTLRTNKAFSPHRHELHRLDALVTERLSSSPNVAKIYGYCGQSTINELARQTGTVLRRGKLSAKRKLQYAIDVANAIATLHDMDKTGRVSLVHRDIKVSNFLISRDGEHLLVHDFNCARLMAWDIEGDSPCAFYKPECAQNRSPEECLGQHLTEKIDVYSMGNVLYAIVTSYLPYTYPRPYTEEEFSQMILNGTKPTLPDRIAKSQHPVTNVIVRAMKKCFAYNPSHRPSARDIAQELQNAYDMLYAPSI